MRTSKIILCSNIKLDKEYKNVLSYTESEMLALCNANKITESENFSFIKPNKNEIEVPFTYLQCLTANYIAFQNPTYANKWFFAFIDEIEYRNNSNTRIRFTVDVFSTWWDYWQPKACYIMREHVNDDTIGANTVPENLETGEYIANSVDYDTGLDTLRYVIQVTEWSNGGTPLATNFGGIPMTGGAYVCDSFQIVLNILTAYNTAGKMDAVYNVYCIPSTMITKTQGQEQYDGDSAPKNYTKTINKVNTVDGFTPRCNKLLTFPYQYMIVSNNNGSSNILHYERFSGNTCNFTIKGVPVVGGSIKVIPTNYDGGISEENGLMAGKFPTLNWSDDEYTNWLTQNGVNIGLGVASAGLTIVGGVGMLATGAGAVAGAGSIASGGLAIANQLGSIYQHSLQPNSAKGNTNGGDINVCSSKNGFFFTKMSIRSEMARVIDDYFYRYGYQVNKIKIPNQLGRENFNYVQIGSSENIGYVENGITASEMEEINNIYRRGVTIWHNHANLGDFSVTNGIVPSNN